MKLELTVPEAVAVAEALNHVWKEIFDRELEGDGGHIAAVLGKLRGQGIVQ